MMPLGAERHRRSVVVKHSKAKQGNPPPINQRDATLRFGRPCSRTCRVAKAQFCRSRPDVLPPLRREPP